MHSIRPAWLLLGPMLGACGSPDVAEMGRTSSRTQICTLMHVASGFGLTFAIDATRATELDGATVSICREGDRCLTKTVTVDNRFWSCHEPSDNFTCFVSERDGAMHIITFLDVEGDVDARPLEDGDVWRGTLTDAAGREVLSHVQAVDYVAVCGNFSPACGVDHQAKACVSDGVAACPDIVPGRPCPEDAGVEPK